MSKVKCVKEASFITSKLILGGKKNFLILMNLLSYCGSEGEIIRCALHRFQFRLLINVVHLIHMLI